MNVQITSGNREIFKRIFRWVEIQTVNREVIAKLSRMMGEEYAVRPEDIRIRMNWGDNFNFTIVDANNHDKKLFYIKRLWEVGTMKEVLGMELGNIFDPELCLGAYIVGTFRTKYLKREVPFLMTPWIPGRPIGKEESLEYPFEMGRHYEFARWLCLYDCYPRHYFLQPDGVSIKRIDYGQAFFKLNKEFEGFADIWPKKLFSDHEFYKGIEHEHNKIRTRAEIAWEDIMQLLNGIEQLELDGFFSFRGPILKREILTYWKGEGFLDENLRIPSKYKFLHVVKTTKNGQ